MGNAVDLHRSDESSIVDLNPGNLVGDDNPSPRAMGLLAVRRKSELAFDQTS